MINRRRWWKTICGEKNVKNVVDIRKQDKTAILNVVFFNVEKWIKKWITYFYTFFDFSTFKKFQISTFLKNVSKYGISRKKCR